INIKIAPIKKIAINQRLCSRNTSLINSQYSLNGKGSSSLLSLFLIKNIIIKVEIAQNTGIEKNGKNQTIAVKADPKIGLNTFPIVFDVSMIPSVVLASASRLNISPTNGKTIGIAPEAPIPCK